MLTTCRIPCPLRTASEYFIYTYLKYLDIFAKRVSLLFYYIFLFPMYHNSQKYSELNE